MRRIAEIRFDKKNSKFKAIPFELQLHLIHA